MPAAFGMKTGIRQQDTHKAEEDRNRIRQNENIGRQSEEGAGSAYPDRGSGAFFSIISKGFDPGSHKNYCNREQRIVVVWLTENPVNIVRASLSKRCMTAVF